MILAVIPYKFSGAVRDNYVNCPDKCEDHFSFSSIDLGPVTRSMVSANRR